MRSSWLALLLLAGCSRTELGLSFGIGTAYRSQVTTVDLRVVEPPVAEPFTCDDIAYANVDSDVVRLATVFEISGSAQDRISIGEVDRVKPKLFWADGKDMSGTTLVTGCAEVGEITSSLTVEIAAEPIAVVAVSDPKPLIFQQGMTGATPSVSLIANDRLNNPIADVSALWKVTGAGDMGSSSEAKAQPDGRIVIAPPAPPRPGPFVLAIRVRWASTPVIFISGAVTPSKETIQLMGRASTYVTGRIGPQKEPGIAALVVVNGEDRVQIAYRSGGSFVYRTSDRLSSGSALGMIDMHGNAPDRLIAVSATDWNEIGSDGLLTRRAAYASPDILGIASPTGVYAAGDCAATDAPLIAVSYDSPVVVGIFDANGSRQRAHFLDNVGEDITASGCVGSSDAHTLRTYVLGKGSIPLLTVAQTNGGSDYHAGGWIALSSGIGFSGGQSPLLLGTQINGNDLVIARARLKLGMKMTADELVVDNLGTDGLPFPYQPMVTAAGEIDGDGKLDVVSLLAAAQQGMPDLHQLWAILGLENDHRRVAGPMIPSISLADPTLIIGDLDGDNISDVIIGERPSSPATQSAVEIYRLGAMN
ncbi:MAG: hypothetical protein U1E65_03845 [Myxococcota bacterium]